MPDPVLERFTPQNTTILMVDYSVGFLNSFRSHTVTDHLQATVALAQAGLGFHSGFVVNLGSGQTPYPQLVQALGDHPIIYRGGEYNALENADVLKAVEDARPATPRDRRDLDRRLRHRDSVRRAPARLHGGPGRGRDRG